ncbi:MAG: tetratricopeptide repeat protein [Campylobacterales bacterium]
MKLKGIIVGVLSGVLLFGFSIEEGKKLADKCIGGNSKACDLVAKEMEKLGHRCGTGDTGSCQLLYQLQGMLTAKVAKLGLIAPGFHPSQEMNQFPVQQKPIILHGSSPEEVVGELRKKCEKGDGEGCLTLAQWYEWGYFVTRNGAEALKYYEKACKEGEGEGCYIAGLAWLGEKGLTRTPPNRKVALNYFKKGCKLKNQQSCEKVGELLSTGEE